MKKRKIRKPKIRVTTELLGFKGSTGTIRHRLKKGKGSYTRKEKYKGEWENENGSQNRH